MMTRVCMYHKSKLRSIHRRDMVPMVQMETSSLKKQASGDRLLMQEQAALTDAQKVLRLSIRVCCSLLN